ncbi:MAG: DNA-binding NtrC family response regulator [Arcticibacterium sp.]|jgi:DNA-binding NtrC family response regulator
MTNSPEIQAIKNRFGIIGNASTLNYALNIAMQVAPTDLTVMISGESGSGKESFSKIIHGLGARKHGPFIAINCGAIPGGTIDSELFGHTKGAFTGATDDRKGYFETTDGGTIFLDEIGEMPIGTQSRLLRVLENGEYIQVGSSKVRKTNVRVVAATNVNLFEAVDRGKFREDLYYRLNTVPISVPPLRDRGFDIELLFIKFTSDFAEKNKSEPVELTEAARKVLSSFRFPGNIRQLKNIAEQITLLEPSRIITGEALEKYLPRHQSSRLPALMNQFGDNHGSDISEREILYKVLFDMRKDVTELKKLVLGLIKGGQIDEEYISENSTLFENLTSPSPSSRPYSDEGSESPYPVYSKEDDKTIVTIDNLQGKRDNVEDITHEMEEESLSLERNENEMILKALRKNNFKRKYAAIDLGISERTLYRKIKQYDIDDEK